MADVAARVALVTGGKRYGGWKSIRVTRSVEGLCGSFALDANDRWRGDEDPWPIAEGDFCKVQIFEQTVITGYIDKRKLSANDRGRSLSFQGRDKAADLVDCSVLIPDSSTKGSKWMYRNIDIAGLCKQIAALHGITVSVQAGLKLQKDPLLVAHPGETGFEAIKRAAASAGVIVVSDGLGGILITQSGTERAASLVEGENIKECEIEYDSTDRFHRYLISTQPPGSDDANGEATRVQGEATDADVQRVNRVLVIRPEKGYDKAGARKRAEWEARIRAAKSATASVTVQGWEQPSGGALWKENTITRVKAPRLLGIDGDMLISQVEFSIGDGGEVTQLKLVRPDAFTPEPQNAPSTVKGEGAWKQQVEKGKF